MVINPLASGSKGNCYHVTDGQTAILLDCGLPMAEINRKLSFSLHTIHGVLLSHEHMDHARGAAKLGARGIPIYTGAQTADQGGIPMDYVRAIKHGVTFQLGTWAIMPYLVKHDAGEPLAFHLHSTATDERLLYITDAPFSQYRFPGLTHIMIEANYDLDTLRDNVASGVVHPAAKRRIIRTHFSIQTAIQFLKATDLSRVQEIHLIHLSDNNSDAARFQKRVQEATGKVVKVA